MKLWELALIYLVVNVPLGLWLWPYSVNTWLAYMDKEPTMLWWHGAIFSLVPGLGQLWIVTAPVTWIAMMFLL